MWRCACLSEAIDGHAIVVYDPSALVDYQVIVDHGMVLLLDDHVVVVHDLVVLVDYYVIVDHVVVVLLDDHAIVVHDLVILFLLLLSATS